MGYADESLQVMDLPEKTADNLAATGDDLILDVHSPIDVYAADVLITTSVVSDVPVVVKVDKRPTAGSDTGRGDGDIAVITIPAGTAAGKVVRKVLSTPVSLVPGDQAVFQVTTAAGGGGAAGNGRYALQVRPKHEVDANLSDVVLSV